MNNIYISLGSNIENREKNLKIALAEITESGVILKKSSIYETEPTDFKKQPQFLNMVIEIETDLNPLELIFRLQEIERKMGRKRLIKKGPRIIDLDIIFFGDKIINIQNLKIPHPKGHLRNFILTPLKEINASYLHPQFKQDINALHKNLKSPEKCELYEHQENRKTGRITAKRDR